MNESPVMKSELLALGKYSVCAFACIWWFIKYQKKSPFFPKRVFSFNVYFLMKVRFWTVSELWPIQQNGDELYFSFFLLFGTLIICCVCWWRWEQPIFPSTVALHIVLYKMRRQCKIITKKKWKKKYRNIFEQQKISVPIFFCVCFGRQKNI